MGRLSNFAKPKKRKLNVIIEDSESGFDLYKDFLMREFKDFGLNIVEEFDSDGKRLGGYNNISKVLVNFIKTNPEGDILIIFDSLLTYNNKIRLFFNIYKNSTKVSDNVYYFSPLCSESIIMQVLDFDEDSDFNFMRNLFGNSSFYFNNVEYKINVFDNRISLVTPNGEVLEGKTVEKILASYVSQITKKAKIHCNKDKIDKVVSEWLREKNNDLIRLKDFINTGESSNYLLEGVI